MKSFIKFVMLALVLSINGQPLKATLMELNPMKSHIGFETSVLGFFKVEGNFLAANVSIKLRSSEVIERIEVKIDTASISTGLKIRNRHLRGKRFFDCRNHPYIVFVAQGPIPITAESVTGRLQIKGVKKKVTIPVKFEYVQSEFTQKYNLVAQSSGFELSRHDFNVGGWPFIVQDKVTLSIDAVTQNLRKRKGR